MNKDDFKELFKEPLVELDEFSKEIKKIKDIINLIIDNFDLLKDNITDEQVGELSSEMNIKVSEIIVIIKDIMTDSKKLEAFINEIKLLKRKRENKLNKNKNDDEYDMDIDDIITQITKYKPTKKTKMPLPNQPNQPNQHPYWKIVGK